APDMTGFPNPRGTAILDSLLSVIPERRGFPVMPAGYFRFTAAPPAMPQITLVDVDPSSPEQGATFPVVAKMLPEDRYVPSDLVGVAPVPGIVLRPDTQYA